MCILEINFKWNSQFPLRVFCRYEIIVVILTINYPHISIYVLFFQAASIKLYTLFIIFNINLC